MTTVHAKQDVLDELRAAGLTATVQRQLVLAVLPGRERPVTTIELHEQLRGHGRQVGLTTVYRTLHALADAGLVHVFHRDGELAYRHCRDGPHHHLVCEVCGLVVERPTQTVARWLQQGTRQGGLRPRPAAQRPVRRVRGMPARRPLPPPPRRQPPQRPTAARRSGTA